MSTLMYGEHIQETEVGSTLTAEVLELLNCHIEGNITPLDWYSTIQLPDGKPDVIAITILSDVVYWYRPKILRDENTGKITGYKKKFREDILQRGYKEIENLFGFSKKQIREALCRLEKIGAVKREFRTIQIRGSLLTNVMFLRIFPAVIKTLTEKNMRASIHESNKNITLNNHTKHNMRSSCKAIQEERAVLLRNGYEVIPFKEPPHTPEEISLLPKGNEVSTFAELTPNSQGNTYTKTSTKTSLSSLSYERVLLEIKEIWEKNINSSNPITITKPRQRKILQIFEEIFKQDLNLWKRYVSVIAESNFLMGRVKDFRVNFDWAINPNNVLKVLEGAYTNENKDKHTDKLHVNKEIQEEALSHIRLIEDQNWREVNKILFQQDLRAYIAWIQKLKFFEFRNNTIYLEAAGLFIRDYVETNFSRNIKRCYKMVMKRDVNLRFITKDNKIREEKGNVIL